MHPILCNVYIYNIYILIYTYLYTYHLYVVFPTQLEKSMQETNIIIVKRMDQVAWKQRWLTIIFTFLILCSYYSK